MPGQQNWRKAWRQNWPQAWAAELATSRGSRIDHTPKQRNWPRRPGQQSWPQAWAAELATGLGNRIGHRPGKQNWPQSAAAESTTGSSSRIGHAGLGSRICHVPGQQHLPQLLATEEPKHRRKRRRMVVKYGLEEIERPKLLNGENAAIQHGRLIADAIAAGILSRADSNNGKITDEDILCVFRQWTFRNTM